MPPTERAKILQAAAAQRRETTLNRAYATLMELEAAGEKVSLRSFCDRAGVSRTWLYGESELLERVGRLRGLPANRTASAREPASDRSNRVRLEVALARNQELEKENRLLKEQLAHALGKLRQDARQGLT